MNDAQEAVRFWGGSVVRPLRLRENEVYEVRLGGQRAALRLHRIGYQSEAAILSELWWCSRLGEAGLPVATPIAGRSGEPLCRLPSGRLASVVSWVEGEPLGEAGVPLAGSRAEERRRHRDLGALLARVHDVTDGLALPDWFQRPAWDREGLVGETPFWGRFWDHPGLSADDRALLSRARAWLAERLDSTRSPTGLIHADVLRENIFVTDHSLSLIDFDDSGFGFRWYDLGTVLSQDLYEPDYPGLRDALIEGYASIRDLSAEEVDAFTLARTLASVGWAATRLTPDHPVQKTHAARAAMMARRLCN